MQRKYGICIFDSNKLSWCFHCAHTASAVSFTGVCAVKSIFTAHRNVLSHFKPPSVIREDCENIKANMADCHHSNPSSAEKNENLPSQQLLGYAAIQHVFRARSFCRPKQQVIRGMLFA